MIKMILALNILSYPIAYAHQAHKHSSPAPTQNANDQEAVSTERLNALKTVYQQEIQPIFKQKCMDCHSRQTTFPWYYKLPGAKQLIDHDIREAKTHLDMTDGFPFLSHGTPREDLEAIHQVVEKGEMPPWRYRVLHSDSPLTAGEIEKIKAWASTGMEALK